MRSLSWRGRSARPLSWLLAGLLLVLGSGAEAQMLSSDCGVLERLAGKWIGRGSLQRHALSGAEPVRCRLDSDWSGARREVASRLDCRGVDGDLSFVGSLAATGSEGRMEGVLQGSEGLDQGVLAGWCETDAVRLDLTGRNPTTGDPVEANLVISLSDGDSTQTNAMEARDPESGEWFPALMIRFER